MLLVRQSSCGVMWSHTGEAENIFIWLGWRSDTNTALWGCCPPDALLEKEPRVAERLIWLMVPRKVCERLCPNLPAWVHMDLGAYRTWPSALPWNFTVGKDAAVLILLRFSFSVYNPQVLLGFTSQGNRGNSVTYCTFQCSASVGFQADCMDSCRQGPSQFWSCTSLRKEPTGCSVFYSSKILNSFNEGI